jgi:hypothetical protein
MQREIMLWESYGVKFKGWDVGGMAQVVEHLPSKWKALSSVLPKEKKSWKEVDMRTIGEGDVKDGL